MSLTEKQIYDLNNMNVAAQNARLGNIIQTLIINSGGSGGDFSNKTELVFEDSYLRFPNVGNQNNLYIDTNDEVIYRWDNKSHKYYNISYNYNNLKKIIGGTANG